MQDKSKFLALPQQPIEWSKLLPDPIEWNFSNVIISRCSHYVHIKFCHTNLESDPLARPERSKSAYPNIVFPGRETCAEIGYGIWNWENQYQEIRLDTAPSRCCTNTILLGPPWSTNSTFMTWHITRYHILVRSYYNMLSKVHCIWDVANWSERLAIRSIQSVRKLVVLVCLSCGMGCCQ